MAQKPIRGTEGNFAFSGNAGGLIAAWRGRGMTDVNDLTAFGGNDAKSYLDGLYEMKGTASGFMTHGTAQDQPGFPFALSYNGHGTLTLTATTGCTLIFAAYFSEVNMGEDVHNNATIAFSFQSTGVINTTWNTTG